MEQGKLAGAEQMYQQALRGKEEVVEAEHISTLNTIDNLGSLYRYQGKLAEAEQMLQRVVQGYQKALGTEDSWTYVQALH
jgi:hypothetical protein